MQRRRALKGRGRTRPETTLTLFQFQPSELASDRGNALLGRWRALDRVTVCPQRIGAIAAAALVLTSLD